MATHTVKVEDFKNYRIGKVLASVAGGKELRVIADIDDMTIEFRVFAHDEINDFDNLKDAIGFYNEN